MNNIQLGDVLLFQSTDDGEINEVDGVTEMTQGLETMYYLILCGGNLRDLNTPETKALEWLGNEDEPQENQLRGRFQSMLDGMPITSGTLSELRDVAIEDLTNGFKDMITKIDVSVIASSISSVIIDTNLLLNDNTVVNLSLEVYKNQ